ncbi:MAG: hypothetical protein ACOCUU_01580 [Nanoarchaeota archaeon]
MKNTTIQVSKSLKDQISSFGSKNKSYKVILRKIYNLAVKEQLRQFLESSIDSIFIDKARKELEKEWPRSK